MRIALATFWTTCVLSACAAPLTTPTRLTDGPATHTRPAWSPDGQWIAYVASGSWGDAVCIARGSDGLTQAITGGLEGSVVGRLQWLAGPLRVAWVTDRGHVGTLDLVGEVMTTALALPSDPRGLAPLDAGHAVAVCSRSSVVRLPADLVGETTRVPIGSVNSDFGAMAPTPDGEGLVLVDSGSVVLWRSGSEPRVLLSPGPDVAEWNAVSTAPGRDSAVVIGRTRAAKWPDRVCALNLYNGSLTELLQATSEVSEAAAVPGGAGVVAVVGGRLAFVSRPGAAPVYAPAALGPDGAPAVSPDGALVAFSSAGRDDTNLDGRVDAGDPPNLYLARLGTHEGRPAQ